MKEEQRKPRYGAILKQYIPDFLEMISDTTKDDRERAIFFDRDGHELCRAKGTSDFVCSQSHIKPDLIKGIFHTHPSEGSEFLSCYDFIGLLLYQDFEVIGHEYQVIHETVEKMVPTINLFEVKKEMGLVTRMLLAWILKLPGASWLYRKKLALRFILKFLDFWTFSKNGEWHYLNMDYGRWEKERKEFYKKAKKTKLANGTLVYTRK